MSLLPRPSRNALPPFNSTRPQTDDISRNSSDSDPNKPEEQEDELTKECRQKGRWINIAIMFGIDLQDIFKIGIQSDMRSMYADDSDEDDEYHNLSVAEKDLLLNAYRAILKFIPDLNGVLPYKDDADEKYFYGVIDAIQDGCNAARSEAIKRIKDHAIRYLAAGRVPVTINAQVHHKELRGLNDSEIGRLLIPAQEVHQWDLDPDAARAKYLSGIFTIVGSDMPVFLYEDYQFNAEDPEEGLFRGSFLVCVLIDILFGPTAVDVRSVKRNHEVRHNGTVGEKYELQTISPENIGYAAVVARFCISAKRTWYIKDGNFNYRTFYRTIVMMLGDHEDPWVQDTLAWWNERVFGNEHGKVLVEDAESVSWREFVGRRAGRKAASRAVEARILALGAASNQDTSQGDADPSNTQNNTETLNPEGLDTGLGAASIQDASQGGVDSSNTHNDAETLAPQSIHDNASVSPSTPPPQPSFVIDPMLLNTPDLDPNTSILTQPSPSVPPTPDAPGPFSQHNTSPLSNISDSEETQGLRGKRRRLTNKVDRPRAKPKRKSAARA